MGDVGAFFLTLALSNVFSFVLIVLAFAGLEAYLWMIDADGSRHRAKLDRWLAESKAPTEATWIFERRLRLEPPAADGDV